MLVNPVWEPYWKERVVGWGQVCSSRHIFSGGISTTNATEDDLDVDLNVHMVRTYFL